MASSTFGNLVWVAIVANHSRLLKDAVPEGWCKLAIPVGLVISSNYGQIVKPDRRWEWKLKLPAQLLLFVGVITAYAYLMEIVDEFEVPEDRGFERIVEYVYVHFGLWMWLCVKATDVSQVLLPMYMLVRPRQCFVLVISRAFM